MGELAERFGADLHRPVRKLSTGNRQKLGLIQAFMGEPELLILDEPIAGLDPLVQRRFHDLLGEVRAQGRTVLLSSHTLSEVDRVADRVAVLRAGRLAVVDTLEHLRGSRSGAGRSSSPAGPRPGALPPNARRALGRAQRRPRTVAFEGDADAVLKAAAESRCASCASATTTSSRCSSSSTRTAHDRRRVPPRAAPARPQLRPRRARPDGGRGDHRRAVPAFGESLGKVDLPEGVGDLLGGGDFASISGWLNTEIASVYGPLVVAGSAIAAAAATLAGEEERRILALVLAHPVARTRLLLAKPARRAAIRCARPRLLARPADLRRAGRRRHRRGPPRSARPAPGVPGARVRRARPRARRHHRPPRGRGRRDRGGRRGDVPRQRARAGGRRLAAVPDPLPLLRGQRAACATASTPGTSRCSGP